MRNSHKSIHILVLHGTDLLGLPVFNGFTCHHVLLHNPLPPLSSASRSHRLRSKAARALRSPTVHRARAARTSNNSSSGGRSPPVETRGSKWVRNGSGSGRRSKNQVGGKDEQGLGGVMFVTSFRAFWAYVYRTKCAVLRCRPGHTYVSS